MFLYCPVRSSTRRLGLPICFLFLSFLAAPVRGQNPVVGSPDAGTGTAVDAVGICNRTEAVRVELVDLVDDTYTEVTGCADVTEAHLAALAGALNLRSSGIDSLQADDFSGLANLTRLDLSRNNLDELPEGVFAGLVNLKDLDLWFNRLHTLPANIFAGLENLQDLDIEENQLNALPAGVFSGLRLRFLGLENNELRTLPAGVFANLEVTWTLDLSGNKLDALHSDMFSSLGSMRLLDLSYNELNTLPEGLLSGLTGLEVLWLDGNPGAPFVFTMFPKRISGTNKVVVTVAYGAPFDMATTIGETGAVAVFPVTIPTGRTESDEMVLTGSTFTLGRSPSAPRSLLGVKTAVCGLETFNEHDVVLDQVVGVNVTEEIEQLTVSWEVVCGATDYRIQWKSGSEQYRSARQQVVSGTTYTITGLSGGAVYAVRVIARRNHVPDGAPSSEVSGTPGMSSPPTPPSSTIPDAPENLQASAGSAQVTLQWDAPNDDGGADITGYAYRQKESGGVFTAWTNIPESGPGEANARSYTVTGLRNEREYAFRVRAVNANGEGADAEVTVMLPSVTSAENEELPTEVALFGNYPNPFNPETTIRYALLQAGNVRLAVYDLLGHEVAVLVDEPKPAGRHAARFDAGDLPSGAYVYRLQAQDKIRVKVMMLVR